MPYKLKIDKELLNQYGDAYPNAVAMLGELRVMTANEYAVATIYLYSDEFAQGKGLPPFITKEYTIQGGDEFNNFLANNPLYQAIEDYILNGKQDFSDFDLTAPVVKP